MKAVSRTSIIWAQITFIIDFQRGYYEQDLLSSCGLGHSRNRWYCDHVQLGVRGREFKMTTLLDALWWCVATVTTVGYGDVVPVTNLGRIVALVYMFFGISLIATLLAVISNTFYKKRIEKEKLKRRNKTRITLEI